MRDTYKVLDKTACKELASLLASETIKLFIAKTKAEKDEDSGVFKVVISSDAEDRQGEKVNQEGLDFSQYMKNPVVLWGHDYFSPPIGICTNIYRENNKTIAEGKFASGNANPFAQQIRKLYDEGIQRMTSIGFMSQEVDDEGNTQKGEVLEFSFVPIGANRDSGNYQYFKISPEAVKKHNLNLDLLKVKGLAFDIGEKTFEDTQVKMRKVLGVEGESSLSLEEKRLTFEYLKKQYKQFGKETPAFEKAMELSLLININPYKAYLMAKKMNFDVGSIKGAEAGDTCQLDDGTPGVLAKDPKNPKGTLICVPIKEDAVKAENTEEPEEDDDHGEDEDDEPNSSEAEEDLQDTLGEEHPKHLDNHKKSIDEYRKAMANGEDGDDHEKAIQEFHDAADAEHDRHEDIVDKAIDEFTESHKTKAADRADSEDEDEQPDEHDAEEGEGKPSAPHEIVKALEKDIADEHKTHRKNVHGIADEHHEKMCKSIEEDDDHGGTGLDEVLAEHAKSFHKSMKAEHGRHVKTVQKAIDEFKEKSEDAEDNEGGNHTNGAKDKKGMVSDELAEDDVAREKYDKIGRVQQIMWAFYDAYMDEETDADEFEELLDEAIALMKGEKSEAKGLMKKYMKKAGAAISIKNREKIEKAMECMGKAIEIFKGYDHQSASNHLESAHSAMKELLGNPQDGGSEDEESPEDRAGKSSKSQRSKTSGAEGNEDDVIVTKVLSDRMLLKSLSTAINGVLEKHREAARESMKK